MLFSSSFKFVSSLNDVFFKISILLFKNLFFSNEIYASPILGLSPLELKTIKFINPPSKSFLGINSSVIITLLFIFEM